MGEIYKQMESVVLNGLPFPSEKKQFRSRRRKWPAEPLLQPDRQERLLRLVELAQDIVFTADPEGFITYVNPAAGRMLGMPDHEITGEHFSTFIQQEYISQSSRRIYRLVCGGAAGAASLEIPVQSRDGRKLWLELQISLIRRDGCIEEIAGVARNVTARKQDEQLSRKGLEQALVRAERARDEERRFLANMSHEIRNPVHTILGMTGLLYDTPLNSEQREFLDHIHFSSGHLHSLLEDLLDLSKLGEGRLELVPRTFAFEKWIVGMARNVEFKLRGRPVRLELYADPRLPAYLRADSTALNQILLNLLNNAVKFTPTGKIALGVHLRESREEQVLVEFEVADTGIGIPSNKLSAVFDRFVQADPAVRQQFGGSGLGLSIVKQLVDLHGGEITVRSVEGEGTRFRVCLPLERCAPEDILSMEDESRPEVPALRVLLAEDNMLNRAYLEEIFRRWGLNFQTCTNGAEALDHLKHGSYDLILMDLHMPVMDGFEATRRLRNSPEYFAVRHIPVAALTGSALPEEQEKISGAGFTHYLGKPFSPDQLLQLLQEVAGQRSRTDNRRSEQIPAFFDRTVFEVLYGGDQRHARVMFELFLRNTPGELREMEQCLCEGDLSQFASLAHKIKPTFSMVGFNSLEALAQKLETFACSPTGNHSVIEQIFPDFLRQTEDALRFLTLEVDKMEKS